MSITKKVELKLSSTIDQHFDEELADFDAVSPTWDKEVDEKGDFNSVTDADGDLTNQAVAAHDGDVGLRVVFDDANAAYGTMNAAVNLTTGVKSFWIDRHDVAIEDGKYLYLVGFYDGGNALRWSLRFGNNGGAYQLRMTYSDDGGTERAAGAWYTLPADWNNIKIMFARSTGVGNDDGYMRLYLDDALVVNSTGHDNDTRDWDYTRTGMIWTNSTTFSGSYRIDTLKVDSVGAPIVDKLAAKNGTYGMAIPVMNTTFRRGDFNNPTAETATMQECWFHPKSIAMGADGRFVLMSADFDTEYEVDLGYSGGYQIRARAHLDAGSSVTSYYSITDDWHHVRVYWGASTGAGDDNGYMHLYIDKVLQESLTGLDNDTITVNVMYFGAVTDLHSATYGVMYFDDCKWGAWKDVSADVLINKAFSHSQGINGIRPTSLVASPGKFSFYLRNDAYNMLSKVGCYSPDHANALDGFEKGAEVRISYDNEYFWRGKIDNIVPDPSPYKAFTKVTAYDWMKSAETQKFKDTVVATDQRGDEALTTMVDLLPAASQPIARSFDEGKSTFPLVFNSERDEKSSVMSVCQKIAQSELGKIYPNHQDGDGENLVFENRHHGIDETTVQHDFDDNVVSVSPVYNADLIKTKTICSAHPSRIDTSDVILGQIQKSFQIPPGETRSPMLMFRDPDGSDRISASTLAARVSGTDYIANADEDGGGADLTADLTVSENTVSGNSIKLDCENTGSSAIWVTTLQQKGKGIYPFDPVTYEAVASSAYLAQYGEHVLRYDLPYEDDYNQAVSFGDYLLSVWQDPVCQINGLTYYPEESTTLTDAFLAIDIGHRITVNFTQLGIDEDYFVTKISVSINKGKLKCAYNLCSTGSSAYAKLNDSIYGKLDASECKLAF